MQWKNYKYNRQNVLISVFNKLDFIVINTHIFAMEIHDKNFSL